MSGQPLMAPETTDVPISNTIRTIVKRRSAKSGVGEQRDRPDRGRRAVYRFLTHSSPIFSYSRFTAAQAMRKAASSWRGS